MHYDKIFTFASWEDRFQLSLKRILSELNYSPYVQVFYNEESAERTSKNRAEASAICGHSGSEYFETVLSFEAPAKSWDLLKKQLLVKNNETRKVLVDFSTMPRDTLWIILHFLHNSGISIDYIYHKPFTYNNDGWISRDPVTPRLVYKLSGVSTFGLRTALLVVTGFDVERTTMLVNRYEPSKLLLALQTGSQFNNQQFNVECHRTRFSSYEGVKMFDFDAFSSDHGFGAIENEVRSLLPNYNLIVSSLGPKPSAISLFKLHQMHPELALAYTPSREYNSFYSSGIGGAIRGSIAAPLAH